MSWMLSGSGVFFIFELFGEGRNIQEVHEIICRCTNDRDQEVFRDDPTDSAEVANVLCGVDRSTRRHSLHSRGPSQGSPGERCRRTRPPKLIPTELTGAARGRLSVLGDRGGRRTREFVSSV